VGALGEISDLGWFPDFLASPLSIVLDISKHIEVEQKLGKGEVAFLKH
jgi:hypothetical protein